MHNLISIRLLWSKHPAIYRRMVSTNLLSWLIMSTGIFQSFHDLNCLSFYFRHLTKTSFFPVKQYAILKSINFRIGMNVSWFLGRTRNDSEFNLWFKMFHGNNYLILWEKHHSTFFRQVIEWYFVSQKHEFSINGRLLGSASIFFGVL